MSITDTRVGELNSFDTVAPVTSTHVCLGISNLEISHSEALTIARSASVPFGHSFTGELESVNALSAKSIFLSPQSETIKTLNRGKWLKNNKNKQKNSALKTKPKFLKQSPTVTKHLNTILKDQSGLLFANKISAFLPNLPGFDTSSIISELENITALFIALQESSSLKQTAAILFIYLKTHCSGSLLTQMIEYIKTECDFDVLDTQDSSPSPSWINLLKDCKDNWRLVINNPAFKKISTLLSMVAALGLCDLSCLNFDVGGIRIFSIPNYKQHVTACDLTEALIDTITYFIEGGYKCFTEKSLSPFIFSDDISREFETDYFNMLELAPFMKSGNLLRKKNMTENDFDFKLTKIIATATSLHQAAAGSWEKSLLCTRLIQLKKINTEFITCRVDGKLREAPFAIYVEGPSGVGKSSVAAVLMRVVLLSNGFDASDERLVTINEADKYMSTYRSYINGIFIDDLGNTQAQFVEKSPVAKVIEIINNVPAYANMAEADLKGKVSIEPRCVVGTSNLNINDIARQYSNEPYSICRRFPVQVFVTVKKKFAMDDGRLDSNKVHQFYPDGTPSVPDLWDIKVSEPFFDKANGNTRLIKIMNLEEAILHITKLSRKHFCNQSDVVDFASNLDSKMEYCVDCHLPGSMCKCELCKLDTQMFETQTQYIQNIISELNFYESKWISWTNYIPSDCFDSPKWQAFLVFLNRYRLLHDIRPTKNVWIFSVMCGFITLLWSFVLSFMLITGSTFFFVRKLYQRKNELILRLRDLNGAMPIVFKRIRDNHVKAIAATGTLLGIIYMMIRAYRSAKALTSQGVLSPTSMGEINARDKEEDQWAEVHIEPLATTEISSRCTHEELKCNVFTNLFYMELTDSKSTRYADAFFPKSNLAIIPAHMWTEDEIVAKFYRRGGETNGAYFKSCLSKRFAVKIPDTDLYLAWISNSCSVKDLSQYFAVGDYRKVPATMIYKSKSGLRQDFKAIVTPGLVRTLAGTFKGFNYTLNEETFDGMCMGTLVSDSIYKQIIGFHLGGKGKRGGAASFTIGMLDAAETKLRSIEGVLLSKSSGTIMTEQFGVKFFQGKEINSKSPVRFLPKGNNLQIFGSVEGRSIMQTTVVPTKISPFIEEVTGVPQQWGGPQFGPHRWKPWQTSLQHSSCPSIGMRGDLLQKAVIDYKIPLIKMITNNPELADQIRPLTKMQTICGIDGKRFIDKMKPTTSVGYPLSGPKSAYMTLLDPAEFTDFACPVELADQFWIESERMSAEYLAGRRCYPVFKAALKDEPTPLDKEKVRVFQAAPMALQILVRKYFLPLARIISIVPLVSECAVGVNTSGPEWNELCVHVKQHGSDRILAGDYSKYDLRMASQLISAAFRILIDMGKASNNYTDEDISIMEGIATDISQPMMAYNGDYVLHTGSNPSGQNLTVYINSIVNSLLFRCAYFSIYEEKKNLPIFRDVCALITYGDDAKSSVKEGYDEFNHIAVADFLAANDMKFTMPDKTSTPTKFMTDEDADLLKRKNVFNPEIGLIFGALAEESIFKSLHSVLKSKAVSNEEQCMSNIDGALREWFAHGREVYEQRRSQMQTVAFLADISHGCQELQTTYDDCVARYCEKYGITPQEV
jgi:hypothetical protein